ncbi:MAG: alpha/beta hydrolase [Rhodobacteraceae bacterium]|nr:alpha/beta hydrolase [Paracoccaceae bacterium]
MADRHHFAPGACSAEGLRQAEAAEQQPARPFDLASLPQFRADAEQEGAALAQAAIDRHRVTLSDRVIAGIPCQIITPSTPHDGRTIVYFFGGGFTVGSPQLDLPISAALADYARAQVIAPAYPLAPEAPFPAAADACTAVARAVLARHPDTVIAGESAGGNLALVTALRLSAENGPMPGALALLSPAVDLEQTGDSLEIDRDPFLRKADMAFFEGCYLPAGTDRRAPDISPIYGDFGPDFPPVFITSGTRDLLLSGCVRLDRVLRDHGARSELRIWEGMWHVFEYYPDLPEADASLREIARFLQDHLTSD